MSHDSISSLSVSSAPERPGVLARGLTSSLRTLNGLGRAKDRLLLSLAKHRSLTGHPRWALRMSRWIPLVEYGEDRFFSVDGARPEVVARRRAGFARLGEALASKAPKTIALSKELEASLSDAAFVNQYRVPFQFRAHVRERLPVGLFVEESRGAQVRDLDGNWSYELGGSYGVQLFGVELYRRCIERAVEIAGRTGPILGAYHPVVADNVARLKAISGLDEVSFHMSGTEAVMQAVRLARYHARCPKVVRFCGSYHGWWDGVQAGPGNPLPARDVYTLEEQSERSLQVLRTRDDIACVLVNPIQAMHPNGAPPSDSTLLASDRVAAYDKAAYRLWLTQLREVCTARGIALILDEVFLGFRLAPGGAQEYFGVRADLVTYGKTLGGGLPIGVVCGKSAWMRRYRKDTPADVCFARGTFNSHPYVMAAMNEFLRALEEPALRATYDGLDQRWDARAAALNEMLAAPELPVRVANMVSVWTTLYTKPGRYNWMLQFYLRRHGLRPSWIGTGRFIFNHELTDGDFTQICERFVAAARQMRDDGWWSGPEEQTNRGIRRAVLKELMAARLG